jgi:alpha-N-arabinofuranosidase
MVYTSHRRTGKRNRKRTFFCILLFFTQTALFAQTTVTRDITVQVNKPGAAIRPTMWGIFFEDINMAADGGLYAQLVKNRSFEFNNPLMGWKEWTAAPGNGSVLVLNRSAENPDNPRFIRVTHYSDGAYGLVNEGFRGMGIKKGETYHFSVRATAYRDASLTLRLELQAPDGKVIGSARLTVPSNSRAHEPAFDPWVRWARDTVSFTATATEPHARLYIGFEGQGTVDLDMIPLPRPYLETTTRWPPRRSCPAPGRYAPRLHPLPRRLHRRRPGSRQPLPVEKNGRKSGRP